LDYDRAERGKSEIAHPTPVIDTPNPDRQDDGKEPDRGSDESMGMLEEDSSHPFRHGEKKHVVTEGRRPIGHSETDAFARDHSAAANQENGGNRSQQAKRWSHDLESLFMRAKSLNLERLQGAAVSKPPNG